MGLGLTGGGDWLISCELTEIFGGTESAGVTLKIKRKKDVNCIFFSQELGPL